MKAASVALIVVMLIVGCPWLYLVGRMWCSRQSFTIAARSPTMVCVAMAYGLVMVMSVFIHWILLTESETMEREEGGLPCDAMFVLSYSFYPFFIIPYILRALRLVVVYNSAYRREFARYVKWKTLMKAWIISSIIVFIGAAFIYFDLPERYDRHTYGCFFWEEDIVFLPALVATAIPTIILTHLMLRVDDGFKIGRELVLVVVTGVSVSVLEFVLQGFVRRGIITHSSRTHLVNELLAIGKLVNIFVWSMLLPMAQYEGWPCCRFKSSAVFNADGDTKSVDPVADAEMAEVNGILILTSENTHADLGKLFGQFCRKYLCMESWEFILEAVRYQGITHPDEQYDAFIRILDRYLRPTSPQEVNISGTLRNNLSALQERGAFLALDDNRRRTVLNEPLGAIVRLLEQNLLAKFKQSEEMKRQLAAKQKQQDELEQARNHAEGDKALQKLMEIARGRDAAESREGSQPRAK